LQTQTKFPLDMAREYGRLWSAIEGHLIGPAGGKTMAIDTINHGKKPAIVCTQAISRPPADSPVSNTTSPPGFVHNSSIFMEPH
ncbi:MAG: hypothetical protein M3O22_03510, partial [Pseudomonadota bacterium]|nr:hypothetical protein [Pseudomonadota bacterium]